MYEYVHKVVNNIEPQISKIIKVSIKKDNFNVSCLAPEPFLRGVASGQNIARALFQFITHSKKAAVSTKHLSITYRGFLLK